MRRVALTVCLAGWALHGVAAQPGRPEPTDLALVPFDVSVVDAGGRPITGLAADDFVVADGEATVPVAAVQLVGAGDGSRPASAPPSGTGADPAAGDADPELLAARRPGARIVAVYLDEYHVGAAEAPAVRDALDRFVRTTLSDEDLLLVAKPLDSLLSLRLSTAHASALAAIASFEGRRDDDRPRNALERDFFAGDPARRAALRRQVAVSALQAVAAHFARLPAGRKALVVVSGGFVAGAPARGREGLPTVDGLLRAAARATVSLYPLDPGVWASGSAPGLGGDGSASHDLLRRLARDSNGFEVASPSQLTAVAADLRGYYALTLRGAGDGRFHRLDVRVRRPGAQVRVRSGYWAVSPDDVARATAALAPPAPPPPPRAPVRTSRLIRPWVGQSRGETGRTRVTVVWEPAPPAAGERAPRVRASRVVLTATTSDGTTLFDGEIRPSVAGESADGTRAAFDAPPGRIRLSMSIEDPAALVLDTDVRDVVVSALDGPLALGTPAMFRTRTARDFARLMATPDAVPVAAREFSRTERLVVRLPVYSAAPLDVAASLTNRSGAVLRTLAPAPSADPTTVTVDVPLSGLAAGEYAMAFRMAAGGRELRERVAFRVTP